MEFSFTCWFFNLVSHIKSVPEILVALLCFFSIKWYINQKDEPLVNWPIMGMFPSLLLRSHDFWDWSVGFLVAYGGTMVAKGPIFTGLEYLVTCDPRNIEYMLKTNFSNFPKGTHFAEIFDIFGDSILVADSDSWRLQRKMGHARLASSEFRRFVADVAQGVVANALLPVVAHVAREGSVVDLQDVFLRFTFDSSFATIFGRNPESLSINFEINEFAEAIDVVTEAIFYRHTLPTRWWKLLRWFKVGRERKLAKAKGTIDRLIEECISLKKQELVEGAKANDLLSTFINSEVGKSDKFLRESALNYLFAARDTTGVGLTWFLWLISVNPRVEAKILEELRVVFSNKAKDDDGLVEEKRPWVFTWEDLRGLVYLHAAIFESLRLYPPAPINHKSVVKEDVLPSGSTVKPGDIIIYSVHAVGRMDWVWGKDCLEFKPERWIDEDGKLRNEYSNKFFAFHAGPRSCLGKDMALTQIKLAAAAILFNFQVQLVDGHLVTPKPAIVLQMKNGLMVKIKERETQ